MYQQSTSAAARVYAQIAKPLTSSAVGGVVFGSQFPGLGLKLDSRIPYFGAEAGLPAWQVGALFGFLTSFFVEAINNTVIAIDRSSSLSHLPSLIVHAAGGGLSWYFLPQLLSRTGGSGPPIASLLSGGAMTEIGSAWIYQNIIAKGGLFGDFGRAMGSGNIGDMYYQ